MNRTAVFIALIALLLVACIFLGFLLAILISVAQAQPAFDMTPVPPIDPGIGFHWGEDGRLHWNRVGVIGGDGGKRLVLACPIDATGQWSPELGVCWWEEMPR